VTLPIGLWTAVMKPRVLCFGRRQQMYGSDHIWTTGRGHKLVPRTPLYGLFNSKWDHHLQNEYIMLYWKRLETSNWPLKCVLRGHFLRDFYRIRLVFATRRVAPYWPSERIQVQDTSALASLFRTRGCRLCSTGNCLQKSRRRWPKCQTWGF